MCIIMLLKRSVNLRNHWHLKERWRRNWNICIMFNCIFHVKGNCTIASHGHKPVFSWRRYSQKVCIGASISIWICLSVTKTTHSKQWEGLDSDAPERQKLMKQLEQSLHHRAGVQELTLPDVNNYVKEMTGLPSQFSLKAYFRIKTMKIFFHILADFYGNFYDIEVFWEGTLFFQLAESIFKK